MTEAEWLGCADPALMLGVIKESLSPRKWRLFGIACCRAIHWSNLRDERSRRAIEVRERYVDDLATDAEMEAASHAAYAAWLDAHMEIQAREIPPEDSQPVTRLDDDFQAYIATCYATWAASDYYQGDVLNSSNAVERAIEAQLLRDVSDNPFRRRIADPGRLAANRGDIQELAQRIYDDHAFQALPLLADALEEAGCVDSNILDHCREPGLHARGCWVVDSILGKE